MAEEGEIFRWWDDAEGVSKVQMKSRSTYDGINFLMLKNVFSNTSPINLLSF